MGAPGSLALDATERVFREDYGRIVATLIRLVGDFELAEEALREAFVIAVQHWQTDGVPRNTSTWLITAAHPKALDLLRREQRFKRLRGILEREHMEREQEHLQPVEPEETDRLR